ELQGMLGAVPDPFACYLLGRGLKTFALRMERHNASGQAVAEFLERHPKVARVHYPGLESHPDRAVARRQMRGFGGGVSFAGRGGLADARRFVGALRIPPIAPRLRGVESLGEPAARLSVFAMTPP